MTKALGITIELENDAFDETPMTELADILRKLARYLETRGWYYDHTN